VSFFASRCVTALMAPLCIHERGPHSGSGSFSVVRRGVCKKTGLQVAVKTCDKKLDRR
jgi:hypothetical protein